MNQKTLDKLKKNPHYKMSGRQKFDHSQQFRKPMTHFGTPQPHNQQVPIHDVNQEKVQITQKKKRIVKG